MIIPHEVALQVIYSDPQVVAGGGPSPAHLLKQPPPQLSQEEAVGQLQAYADYLYSQPTADEVPGGRASSSDDLDDPDFD